MITLVVIGIIAAITVPIAMANHKKIETANRIKKFYSNFTNAIKQAETEQGIPSYSWPQVGNTNEEFFNTYLAKYISYSKIVTNPSDMYSDLMGGELLIYLNDGMIVGIASGYPTKSITLDVNGEKGPNSPSRDIFDFELMTGYDGAPPSNKDRYLFTPTCADYNSEGETDDYSRQGIINAMKDLKGTNSYAIWCGSTLFMMDGMEFKDDYPYRL